MDVLAIAATGMQGDLARLEIIAHNNANALTPGYKRQVHISSAFAAGVDIQTRAMLQSAEPSMQGIRASALDTAAGALRPSANRNDVAINGTAFFEVMTPAGVAFTRQGNLRADVQGRLVTGQDVPVMGASGEIRVTNSPFSVSPNGEIVQEGRVVGRLKTVEFTNPQDLLAVGAATYSAGSAVIKETSGNTQLRIGFLEGSNVNTPHEMVRLTETVRHFESLQKLVQGYDEVLEKTIRKLGEF